MILAVEQLLASIEGRTIDQQLILAIVHHAMPTEFADIKTIVVAGAIGGNVTRQLAAVRFKRLSATAVMGAKQEERIINKNQKLLPKRK